jgi:hypothetical protein
MYIHIHIHRTDLTKSGKSITGKVTDEEHMLDILRKEKTMQDKNKACHRYQYLHIYELRYI